MRVSPSHPGVRWAYAFRTAITRGAGGALDAALRARSSTSLLGITPITKNNEES